MMKRRSIAVFFGLCLAHSALGMDFRNFCEPHLRAQMQLDAEQTAAVHKTVNAILVATQSSNCEQGWHNLQHYGELQLASMELTDLRPLQGFQGEALDLADNNLENLWGLEHLSQLRVLIIRNNHIQDLSVLSLHDKLEVFDISNNPIDLDGSYVLKELPQLSTLYAEGTTFVEDGEEVLSLAHHLFNIQIQVGRISEDDLIDSTHRAIETIRIADYIAGTQQNITLDDLDGLSSYLDDEPEDTTESEEPVGLAAMTFVEKFLQISMEITYEKHLKDTLANSPHDRGRSALGVVTNADRWNFQELRQELKIAPLHDRDIDNISRSAVNKNRIRSLLHVPKMYAELKRSWEAKVLETPIPNEQKSIMLDMIQKRAQLSQRVLEYYFASSKSPAMNEPAFAALTNELKKACPYAPNPQQLLQQVEKILNHFQEHQVPLGIRAGL